MRSLLELRWVWIFPRNKLSYHSCRFSFLDDAVDFGSFCVIMLLICTVLQYMGNKGFFFARNLSLWNSQGFYLCFQLILIHSVSYFCLYRSPSFLCAVFDAIWSNVDDVFSINTSTNVFVLNVRHGGWLTDSGWTDRPGNPNDLIKMANFPTLILDCGYHSSALLDLFTYIHPSICSTVVSPIRKL